MTEGLPADAGNVTAEPAEEARGQGLPGAVSSQGDELARRVLLVERGGWWRVVRNVLLALLGLYGGATLGCNLGAPAMGIEHRQTIIAVWQFGVAGGIIGGVGLAITARRQRGMFLLWLLFGAGMGAGAAAGAGAMGWWYGSSGLPVHVAIGQTESVKPWYGPAQQPTMLLFGILLGVFLGALLGLGQGRLAIGAIIGAVAVFVIGVAAVHLGHPDPSTAFGSFVGLTALSFLWRLKRGAGAFCKARVLTIVLAGLVGVVVFWLQALYWPRTVVLTPDIQGHGRDSEMRVALSPDGSKALAICGGAVHLWDCKSGRLIGRHFGPHYLEALGFSQKGRALSVRRVIDLVVLWDEGPSGLLPTGPVRWMELRDWDEPAPLIRVVLSPDRAAALIARSDEPFLRELDFGAGTETHHSMDDLPRITSLAWALDRRLVLIGCQDGSVRLIELRGKDPPRVLHAETLFRKPVRELLVSTDGSLAWASSGRDAMVSWNLAKWDSFQRVAHRDRIEGISALSRNGDRLLTGARYPQITPANVVELRNGITGELIRPFLNHNCTLLYRGARPPFVDLAISADGNWAASIDRYGIVRVWRLPE